MNSDQKMENNYLKTLDSNQKQTETGRDLILDKKGLTRGRPQPHQARRKTIPLLEESEDKRVWDC